MRMLFRISVFLLAAALSLAAADPHWAGTYIGDWSSNGVGGNGSFRLTLRSPAEGKWECQVMFTIGEREVKTTVKSLKIDASQIEVSYEFDLSNNRLQSTIRGQLTGNKLEGAYQTKVVPDGPGVDEGAWKATARQ